MNKTNVQNKLFLKLKLVVNILLGKTFYFYKGNNKYDLIIFDTIFPHPVSGFRVEEFKVLLTDIKNSKILLIPDSYSSVKTSKDLHPIHVDEFLQQNLILRNKLKLLKGFININTKLFYCIFINNIYRFINFLDKNEVPFVFTLYPGGGFQMNDEVSDEKLKKVFSSKMFKKVIVTQKITKDYLVDNNFCSEDKIEFIFGGVVPQNSLVKNQPNKKYFKQGKDSLDISFCAAKYMPKGIDKGYDVFIEVAHLLCAKYDFINFHVIGGFDEHDIDVSKIKDKIKFYGYQKFEELEKTFQNIDIIISPNKPFVLGKGAFDGFPLGTVVEAALNGVMVILSDSLKQNTIFINKEDLLIIESDSAMIINEVEHLINNPHKISEIANTGKNKFQEIYSNKFQMQPRIEILKNTI